MSPHVTRTRRHNKIMAEITHFPPNVSKELKFYVYKLIDPRNGQVFYVGKGKGNRVFHHIRDELKSAKSELFKDDDETSLKIKTIREIRNAGLEVIHIIQRHGMNEDTAFEVEAALIEAIPGLTNSQDGHDNSERGCANVKEIVDRYTAQTAKFTEKVLVIKIKADTVRKFDEDVYEAGRRWWRLNKKNAEKAELVVVSVQGIIRGVYKVREWEYSQEMNRIGFIGEPANQRILDKYINKRLPKELSNARTPTVYNWQQNKTTAN